MNGIATQSHRLGKIVNVRKRPVTVLRTGFIYPNTVFDTL